MTISTETRLMDARAVAEVLKCSPRQVLRLADAGKMPKGCRVGTLRRWRAEDIDRWIEAGCPVCVECDERL